MAFDFKKEYREFYLPKNKPELLTVPPMNFLAVRAWEIPIKRAALTKRPLAFSMGLPLPSK